MTDITDILQRMAAQNVPQMTMQPIPGFNQGGSVTLADVINKYNADHPDPAAGGSPPAPPVPGQPPVAQAAAPGGGKGGALNTIAQHIGES